MSVSIWQRRERPTEHEATLCIIGGGIAGITALRLADLAGIETVLLERHTTGSGASTRNAGYIMRGADDNYAAACDNHGREIARALWALSERTRDVLRALGAIKPRTAEPCPSCLIASSDQEAADLHRSMTLLQEDGFRTLPLETKTRPEDPLLLAHPEAVGLINPADLVCHPARLLEALAEPVTSRIIEQEEVFAIEQEAAWEATVYSTSRVVHARAVLVCTNAYTDALFPEIHIPIRPNRAQMLTLDTSALNGKLTMAYYLDRGGDYMRQLNADTIAIGGQRRLHGVNEQTASSDVSEDVQQSLEHRAAELLGVRLPVAARWAGTMGFTPDHLPLAGPVNPVFPCVHLLAGFTGHGMSLAPAAAEIALAGIAQSLDVGVPGPPQGLEAFSQTDVIAARLRPSRFSPVSS